VPHHRPNRHLSSRCYRISKIQATAKVAIPPEKHDPVHVEQAMVSSTTKEALDDSELVPEARGRDSSDVPKGYWCSSLFLGSYFAIGFGFMSATGGYALIAPILGYINAGIGPSVTITWVALVSVLCQSVTFLIVGRLSDIFGRRWFFMIAVNVLSVICWYLFYHPPTFKMLHRRTLAKDMLLRFDWIGLILYTAGFLIFLMGLVWGGTLYPWKSARVIWTTMAGAVGLVIFIA
jgi:MFS family permease